MNAVFSVFLLVLLPVELTEETDVTCCEPVVCVTWLSPVLKLRDDASARLRSTRKQY